MSPAKRLLALMLAAASMPLGAGCLALSLGGKTVNTTRDDESPLVEDRLRSLEARVWNLEQPVSPQGARVGERIAP